MKVMKVKAITLAVVSVLGAGTAIQANAAYFEPWTVTGSEPYTLHIGGATAQDQGIDLLTRRLCTDGTMVRVQGTKQKAMMCEANGVDSLPIALGTKMVIYKNSVSGSGSGVNPVAAASTTLPFLNLASLTSADYANPALCTVTTVASTADFAGYKNYACGANILNNTGGTATPAYVVDAGISDVEPALLGWTPSVGAFGDVIAGPQVIFGAPVSKNFRNALQSAQFDSTSVCNPANVSYAANADTEACMPSLTKYQIASMYNGGIISLSRLSDITGTVIPSPAGATTVQVCRRKAGSGTLASYKAYFLNEGCASGVKQMTSGVDGDALIPAVSSRVQEYGGTAQVLGCLNAENDANKYAIGQASMENVPGSAYSSTGFAAPFNADTGNWRWIKVHGYAPTLLNTVQSKYEFLMEASWQRGAGTSAQQTDLFSRIANVNGSAPVIRELNAAFVQVFGESGLLGKPGTPTAPSAAPAGVLTAGEVALNPVNTWTRAASGQLNSCQPGYITKETGLDMLH